MDTENSKCRKEQIAAYIDGELDLPYGTLFEQHLLECQFCRAELHAQRLFMCELDSVLTLAPDLPIPQNFAQVIAARAESDMSGVRKRVEHRRALRFCLLLAVTAFALLGAASSRALFFNGRELTGKIFGVFGLLWTTLYNAAVGMAVISRVISGGIVQESPFVGLAALLLALAVVLLSLLISSYHQHREVRLSE